MDIPTPGIFDNLTDPEQRLRDCAVKGEWCRLYDETKAAARFKEQLTARTIWDRAYPELSAWRRRRRHAIGEDVALCDRAMRY